jgi:hypothetical protein
VFALPKAIKVALRVRDKVAQTQDELLRWINNLNPGLHTENWSELGVQPEPKGQRLILHIDRDSLVTIRKTGNKIFTGLSQGIVKVLKDPEMQKRGVHRAVHPRNRPLGGREMELPLPKGIGGRRV